MIVFPMSGLSSRFYTQGYTQPKFMLPLQGKSLFEHIVTQFVKLECNEDFLFIHPRDDAIKNFIDKTIAHIGLPEACVHKVALSYPTRGQAETVMQGLQALSLSDHERITIFNIDTIRRSIPLPPCPPHVEAALELFEGAGEHWSFALPESAQILRQKQSCQIRQIAEKKRISNFCSDGLYIFQNRHVLEQCYQQELAINSGELFVAPLMQHLIAQGGMVVGTLVQAEDLLFSGTPAEYEYLREQEHRQSLVTWLYP